MLENLLGPLGRDWTDYSTKPEAFIIEDSVVVAFGNYTDLFTRTGKALGAQFSHRWGITDAKATNFRQYTYKALVQVLHKSLREFEC